MFAVLLLAIALLSSGPALAASDIVARVDGQIITSDDLKGAIADPRRAKKPDESPEEHRARVLDELINEIIAEKLITPEYLSRHAGRAKRLKAAQRALLLDFYITTNLAIPPPTTREVDAYIAANPDYFLDRKSYFFSDMTVGLASPTQREVLSGWIGDVQRDGAATPDLIDGLVARLLAYPMKVSHKRLRQTSEELDRTLHENLKALQASGSPVFFTEGTDHVRVLILYAATPEPLDPVISRSSVTARLLRESKRQQSEAILTELQSQADITVYGPNGEVLKSNTAASAADQIRNTRPRNALTPDVVAALWLVSALTVATILLMLYLVTKPPPIPLNPAIVAPDHDIPLQTVRRLAGISAAALLLGPLVYLGAQWSLDARTAAMLAGGTVMLPISAATLWAMLRYYRHPIPRHILALGLLGLLLFVALCAFGVLVW